MIYGYIIECMDARKTQCPRMTCIVDEPVIKAYLVSS